MKRLLWVCGIATLLAVPGFAQGGGFGGGTQTDDHDDSGPTLSGYAVVTPATATSALTVMETFGLKDGTETLQAGFAAPDVITSGTLFVDVADRLSRNLALAIANPNNTAASVTFTIKKADGTQLGSRSVSVNAHSQTAQFVTALVPIQGGGLGGGSSQNLTEYTGTLSFTSTVAISVVAIRFRGNKFSTDPITTVGSPTPLPIISSGVGGSSAFLLPQFAAGGGWASQIVLSNSNSAAMTVRVDLFKQDGTPLTTKLNHTNGSSFLNLVVPANGTLVLAPQDASGDNRF